MNYDEMIDDLYFDYRKYQEWIIKHDAEALKRFNISAKSEYFLHEELVAPDLFIFKTVPGEMLTC